MAILSNPAEILRIAAARRRPELSFLSFSLEELLAETRTDHFPEIRQPVSVSLVRRGSLAWIERRQESATIFIHQILNHSETPREVLSLVLIHELLHLRIGPGPKSGRIVAHPQAFFEAERRLFPQRSLAWCWIWENYGGCLKKRPRLERTDVLPNWRRYWSGPKLRIEDLPDVRFNSTQPTPAGW